jgi:hypothetical protein
MGKGGPPRHYHHEQDESFYVTKGEFAFEVGDELQHPVEDLLVRLDVDQPPRARDRRVVGRRVAGAVAEEFPQRQSMPRSEPTPSK